LNDDGFTLPEMLVALVLAGLAVTALATAARISARSEDRVRLSHATALNLERFQTDASAALYASGPFVVGSAEGPRFDGAPLGAAFDCASSRCAIEVGKDGLTLTKDGARRVFATPKIGVLGLRYVSAADGRVADRWPPQDKPDRLAAVVLMDREQPLVLLAVGREQRAACVFDLGTGDCAPATSR